MAFSRARLPANFLASRRRLLLVSIELFFAILLNLSNVQRSRRLTLGGLPAKRKVEGFEQRPRLIVVPRRGADDHIEAPDPLDLVVVDLRKDDVLLDAHRIIAAPVEASVRQAAKVAHPQIGRASCRERG